MTGPSRPRPIYSSHSEDLSKQQKIERFIIELSSEIDELQEAEVQGDYPRVVELATDLRDVSTEHGYPVLSQSCIEVRAAAQAESAEDLRKALLELTEVAHRVRLGYRGSV